MCILSPAKRRKTNVSHKPKDRRRVSQTVWFDTIEPKDTLKLVFELRKEIEELQSEIRSMKAERAK